MNWPAITAMLLMDGDRGRVVMSRVLFLATVLAVSSVSSHAFAQTDIPVPATAAWKHANTGLVFHSQLAGYPRAGIADKSKAELDVTLQYGSEEDTAFSIYIFRPAMMSVPVWFDRSETQILARDIFAHPVPTGPTQSFVPPKASATSALRRSYRPGKGPFKATALAVLPLGEWLVAIRASSVTLDAAGLDGKVDAALAAINWPSDVAAAPAASPVIACAAPLAYAGRARLKQPDTSDSLFGAILAGAASTAGHQRSTAPQSWCRETDGGTRWGAYRADGGTEGYEVALGDAGTTISVFPAFSLKKKANDGYRLTVNQLDRTFIFPSFDKLPSPAKAIEAIGTAKPVSSTSRNGKDLTINM